MAHDTSSPKRPQNRIVTVAIGVGLGFVWGTIMWALVVLLGHSSRGPQEWLQTAVSMAMIGGGVAAVFGAFGARGRGERIGPRVRRSRDD